MSIVKERRRGMLKRLIGILAVALLLGASGAYAGVIIDDFDITGGGTPGTTLGKSDTVGLVQSWVRSTVGPTHALGGIREGRIECLTGCDGELRSIATLSSNGTGRRLSFSNDTDVVGRLDLRYDGSADGGTLGESSNIAPTRNVLDVDFTSGGANEIFSKVISADIGLRIGLVLYGSTASTAPAASASQIATLVVDVASGPSDHHFPFTFFGGDHYINVGTSFCGSSFPGCPNTGSPIPPITGFPLSTVALGGFDFHHVGAVDFVLEGNQAADGSIDFIASSSSVPEPGTLILLGTGLFGLGFVGRLRYRRK